MDRSKVLTLGKAFDHIMGEQKEMHSGSRKIWLTPFPFSKHLVDQLKVQNAQLIFQKRSISVRTFMVGYQEIRPHQGPPDLPHKIGLNTVGY